MFFSFFHYYDIDLLKTINWVEEKGGGGGGALLVTGRGRGVSFIFESEILNGIYVFGCKLFPLNFILLSHKYRKEITFFRFQRTN